MAKHTSYLYTPLSLAVFLFTTNLAHNYVVGENYILILCANLNVIFYLILFHCLTFFIESLILAQLEDKI